MLVTAINSKIQSYTQKLCQSTQCSKVANSYNTNPLACDTFTPSVSFKAAIHDYAEDNDLEGVKRELENGVDVNLVTNNDRKDSALFKAACEGHTEIVKELLNHPDINVNYKNNSSSEDTALTIASYKGNTESVRELLKHPDIDVNIPNSKNVTPLMLAIRENKPDTIVELLKHPDIDLNLKDDDGQTALDYANENGRYEIIKMIEEYVPGVDQREEVLANVKKPPVDITKLSPKEKIWTREELSAKFLKLIKDKKYDDASMVLEETHLIDLEGNNKAILKQVIFLLTKI